MAMPKNKQEVLEYIQLNSKNYSKDKFFIKDQFNNKIVVIFNIDDFRGTKTLILTYKDLIKKLLDELKLICYPEDRNFKVLGNRLKKWKNFN